MTQRHFCTFWLKLLYWELFVLWLFYLHIIVSDFVFMRGMCVCVCALCGFRILVCFFLFCLLACSLSKGKEKGMVWSWVDGEMEKNWQELGKVGTLIRIFVYNEKKRNKFLETGFIYFIFKWNSFSKYWDKSIHLNTYTHIKFHSNNLIASYAHILHK